MNNLHVTQGTWIATDSGTIQTNDNGTLTLRAIDEYSHITEAILIENVVIPGNPDDDIPF